MHYKSNFKRRTIFYGLYPNYLFLFLHPIRVRIGLISVKSIKHYRSPNPGRGTNAHLAPPGGRLYTILVEMTIVEIVLAMSAATANKHSLPQ